jgi:hypothetical protein
MAASKEPNGCWAMVEKREATNAIDEENNTHQKAKYQGYAHYSEHQIDTACLCSPWREWRRRLWLITTAQA